jgi:hypothetical protein
LPYANFASEKTKAQPRGLGQVLEFNWCRLQDLNPPPHDYDTERAPMDCCD